MTSDPAWLISRKPFPGRILVHCCSSGAHSDDEAVSLFGLTDLGERLFSPGSRYKSSGRKPEIHFGELDPPQWDVMFTSFCVFTGEKVEIFSLILITQQRAQRAAAGHPSERANHSEEHQQHKTSRNSGKGVTQKTIIWICLHHSNIWIHI